MGGFFKIQSSITELPLLEVPFLIHWWIVGLETPKALAQAVILPLKRVSTSVFASIGTI